MTKEETKKAIEVMQAWLDGKVIQSNTGKEAWAWCNTSEPCWNWKDYDYRIKPEPMELWAWVHPANPASPILANGPEEYVGAWVKKKFREVTE